MCDYYEWATFSLLAVDTRFFWIMSQELAVFLSALREEAGAQLPGLKIWKEGWFRISNKSTFSGLWSKPDRDTLLLELEQLGIVRVSRSSKTNQRSTFLRILWAEVKLRIYTLSEIMSITEGAE